MTDVATDVTILVVEDDPDVREGLADLLRFEGYSVTTTGDGLHALQLLKAAAFDLVLTDLQMPRMDGATLLKRAAEEGLLEGISVVIATARPEIAPLAAGPVLPKPFDVDRLLAEVAKCVRRR